MAPVVFWPIGMVYIACGLEGKMHQFTVMEDLSLYAYRLALRVFSFHMDSTCSRPVAGNQCISRSGQEREVGGIRHTW